jgi:hypothetical protein
MKLDNEEQRSLLLQLLDMATFPGAARKAVYELGAAIETAGIESEAPRLEEKA